MSNPDSIDLNNYKKLSKIGAGSFGEVFKIKEKKTGKIYAAKISTKYFDDQDHDEIKNLTREVENISKIKHPSIIEFIGFSFLNFEHEYKPVIVTEYLPNGSLNDMIQLERKSIPNAEWTLTLKLINIYGIAAAMSFLHFRDILHRDLKPDNILLDQYLFPKLADFGLSKDENIVTSTLGIKGTPFYIAPEIFEDNQYSKASDVYAFGILVYELITGQPPFPKTLTIFKVQNKVCKGERPKIKKVPSDAYRELIEKCWDKDPSSRPTFDEIRNQLKKNPKFITDEINKDYYLRYVREIDRSLKSFDSKKAFHIDEDTEAFTPVHLDKKRLLSTGQFNKLNKKCQNLVDEAISDTDKQFEVGKYLIEASNGFPQDIETGILYLKKSIEELNIDAAIYYNKMLISGKIIDQNLEEAKANLKRYSEQKNPDMNVLLGIIERKSENYQEAIDIFYEYCGHNAEASYQLGKMLYRGEGTEENRKEAEIYFKMAKKRNDDYIKKIDNFILKQKNKKKKNYAHDKRKRIDIVFLIDGNKSMLPIHHAFHDILSTLSEEIQKKYSKILFRYASIVYSSKPITDKMPNLKTAKFDKLRYTKFTDDLEEIEAFLTKNKTLSPNRPTDWASGYECLINDIKWNDDADKIAIHICNSPGLGKSFTMDPIKAEKLIKIPFFDNKYSKEKNASIFEKIQKREDARFKEIIENVAKKNIKFYCQNYSRFAIQCFKKVGDYFKKNGGKKFIVEDQIEIFNLNTKVDDNEIKKKIKNFILNLIKTRVEAHSDDEEDNLFETECNNKFEEDFEEFSNYRKPPGSHKPKKPPNYKKISSEGTDEDDEYNNDSDDDDGYKKEKEKAKYNKKKPINSAKKSASKPTISHSSSDYSSDKEDSDDDSPKGKKKETDIKKRPTDSPKKKKPVSKPTISHSSSDYSSDKEDSDDDSPKGKKKIKDTKKKPVSKPTISHRSSDISSDKEDSDDDSPKGKKKVKDMKKKPVSKPTTSHSSSDISSDKEDSDDDSPKGKKKETDIKKRPIDSPKKKKPASKPIISHRSSDISSDKEDSDDDSPKGKKKVTDMKKKEPAATETKKDPKKKRNSIKPTISHIVATDSDDDDDDKKAPSEAETKKKDLKKKKTSSTPRIPQIRPVKRSSSDDDDDDDDDDDGIDFNRTSTRHNAKKKKEKTNPFDFSD